jgi:hypothetical protein
MLDGGKNFRLKNEKLFENKNKLFNAISIIHFLPQIEETEALN